MQMARGAASLWAGNELLHVHSPRAAALELSGENYRDAPTHAKHLRLFFEHLLQNETLDNCQRLAEHMRASG
jgi:hypothetical protein